MKIYFTASVSAIEENPTLKERYAVIVKKLEDLGHTVFAKHVLGIDYAEIKDKSDAYRVDYYRQMLQQINKCDLVFAELSYSSASIGHEVSLALEKNKPIIIASEQGRVPQIFKAIRGDSIYFLEYQDESDLLERLEDEIVAVKEGEDIRFNFLVPPSMVDYLEWVSKKRRIPKSVFLRDLIKREMEVDDGYHQGA